MSAFPPAVQRLIPKIFKEQEGAHEEKGEHARLSAFMGGIAVADLVRRERDAIRLGFFSIAVVSVQRHGGCPNLRTSELISNVRMPALTAMPTLQIVSLPLSSTAACQTFAASNSAAGSLSSSCLRKMTSAPSRSCVRRGTIIREIHACLVFCKSVP